MDMSIFWARFFGLFFIFIGVFYFFRKEFLKQILENYFKNPAISIVVGFINLIIGLFVILTNNVWEFSWRGLITIIGYLLILRAILNFYYVDELAEFAKKFVEGKGYIYTSVILLLIGLYLAFSGFSWSLS